MTVADIFKAIGGDLSCLLQDYGLIGAIILFGGMTVVQVIPSIEFNPWSSLAKAIGKAINTEVIEKVSSLEKTVAEVKAEQLKAKAAEEERNAKGARTRILRFGDEVRNQERHTKEHFDDVLRDITGYEDYCNSHPHFQNSQAVLTIEHIRSVYRERLSKNDFL